MNGTSAIVFADLCRREGVYFQRGMYFGPPARRPVLLVTNRGRNPYDDWLGAGGETLIYHGHNAERSAQTPFPQLVDQPLATRRGRPTQNGLFFEAARAFRDGRGGAVQVAVYRKLRSGVWLDLGEFQLIDAWMEWDGRRRVCRFKLRQKNFAGWDDDGGGSSPRSIPAAVKAKVWNRDGGRCVVCGATRDLHFDHVVPVAKGGSCRAENVQLMCARHNLEKSDKIR